MAGISFVSRSVTWLLGAAVFVGICPLVHAQELSIKGLTLGDDLRSSAAKASLECLGDEASAIGMGCHRMSGQLPDEFRTLGGQPVRTLTMYGFGGKLGMVSFTLPADSYAAAKDAIGSRYGTLSCQISKIRSRAGVEYDQEICEATTPLTVLRMQKRSGQVDQATIRLMGSEYMAQSEARMAAQRAKAKGDI